MTRKFTYTLERCPHTSYLVAISPGLPGICSQGADAAEARANLREAVQLYLECRPEGVCEFELLLEGDENP